MPRPGEKVFRYGFTWKWIARTSVIRGHWKATDHTGVEVLPPSEGIDTWMVTTPKGRREVLVQLANEDEAFRYAAATRRARAAH